ncbi:N-acyl-D-amino acid deacylase [Pontibacter diazotrophicus]|uniref:N-acyl-D-amino acid deacylase n=1 Tax=Pontibacter diazotrophicus TaxID=1400979 RepID=A0A3D8L887_9BACT|nr:amidohydrolase family protein [Pontibacter diazotrophicus]RDV13543.1 N-acyl-D-amino acid deacylase [Pontibacter diazotrophicus]
MKKTLKKAQQIFAYTLLAILLVSCQQEGNAQTYDLLLRKASVVDGTGQAPYVANLLVSGDSIALIDRDTSSTYSAGRTIDADGLVLTPGFIDTHAHGDPLETPEFKNFLSMGVTTICLGQDGFSPEEKDISIWMEKVSQKAPAVNIAMFAGHGTLRMLSGIQYDSVPSDQKLAAMEKLLANALDAGCFGMTTGLEYTPGYIADSTELNRMAKVVGAKEGLIMSHMRNEDDAFVEASIRELLAQGRYCPVHVSHMKVVFGKGQKRAEEVLQLLDSARTSGIQVTADFYPYTASYTGIAILFPEWAQRPNDYQQVLKTKRAALGTYLQNRVMLRNGPEATLIGSGPYKGKTLAQVSTELDKPFQDVLMDDIGPYGASGAYFVMDETLQETLLKNQHVMVCTDGSPTMHHPRGYGTYAKVIETYVENQNLLTLTEAVRKMSGLPAETIDLKDRGIIREGYKADILLFDPSEVQENATYGNPHQLASGFRYVIINGQIVKEGTQFSSKRAGKMLKKKN